MKKFIYVVITVLILSIGLNVTSFATATVVVDKAEGTFSIKRENAPVITFSDDFRTLYYNGYTYYQKDLALFESYIGTDYETDAYYYEDYDDVISTDDYDLIYYADYELTEKQEKTVKSVDVSGDGVIVYLTVYYKDGTSLSLDLLREDYLDDYDNLLSEKYTNYEVDFEYPDGNIVKVDREVLFENEKQTVNSEEFYNDYMTEYVYLHSDDGVLSYQPGLVVSLGDDFYYFSYEENNMYPDYEYGFFDLYWSESDMYVHKITNEQVVAELQEAEQAYYEDDFGVFENDELANSISYFFLILIFGVVPGIAFIVSLIFAIIKKKTYRKLLFTVCGFTLAEIITFIIFMVLISTK